MNPEADSPPYTAATPRGLALARVLRSSEVFIWEAAPHRLRSTLTKEIELISLLTGSQGHCLSQSAATLHPDDIHLVAAALSAIIQQGRDYNIEYRVLGPDGAVRWFADLAVLLREHRDDSGRLIGVARDITDRKQVEEALSDAEGRLQRTAEGMADQVIDVQMDGTIDHVSPAATDFLGHNPELLRGRTVFDLATAAGRPLLARVLKAAAAGANIWREFIDWERSDGTRLASECSAAPRYEHGAVVGACIMLRDISESVRLKEQESLAQRLATAGRVAGQVAHDFNNLLSPLKAYPDIIKGHLPVDHPALPLIRSIEESAERMAEINEQFLTLGRRGVNAQQLLNPCDVIRQALNDLGHLPSSMACDIDLGDNLDRVRGCRAQLHRAFLNLLLNARDAVANGGRISVRVENCSIARTTAPNARVPEGEYVRVTVADTGCGIASDIVPRIFEPFFTTKMSGQRRGCGLGLCVVDEVVRDLGGYIDLTTKPGDGTTFALYLPAARDTENPLPAETAVAAGPTVLIVDDDPMQREVMSRILSGCGYTVDACSSGEEAVAIVSRESRDLLILDIVMPGGLDGIETYKRVLALNPEQRAVFVSGLDVPWKSGGAPGLHGCPFLQKPVDKRMLAALVRTRLDRPLVDAAAAT